MDNISTEVGNFAAPKSLVKMAWGSYKKAILGSFVVALVGTFILLVSMFSGSSPARAMGITPTVSPMPVITASPSANVKVNYPLPYPGMLPDSPFYKLKALRDKLSLMFVSDGLAKAKKELLLADKRINAAEALMEGGKEDLAVSTATKGEKYLEQAAILAIDLQKQKQDVKPFLQTLRDASKRHLEIIANLEQKSNGDNKTVMAKTNKATMMVLEKVEQAIRE